MGVAPIDETIFQRLPNSRQNPLLSAKLFAKYSQRRFRWASSARSFAKWLELRVETKLIRPAYQHDDTPYFSTYQIWQVDRLSNENFDSEPPAIFSDFEVLLNLMVRIQDFYLPEIRSNQRFGEHQDYGGKVAIGGTYFYTKTQYLLSYVRELRQFNIESGNFDPAGVASQAGLDAATLEQWSRRLQACAKRIDPLSDWREIIKYVRYGQRQRLRFEALLAQDYYAMAELLTLFLADLDSGSDSPLREHASRIRTKKVDRYGENHSRPYKMLEFLSNQYDLNPKPRAIVFTEGEEWKAIKTLYKYHGYDPELLGIDFRSISGEGNFSLANWQAFIEYMHERQVLVYFLLDREGRTESEAKRLLRKKRIFSFPGLQKVVPSRDRIRVWAQSFEESNFTDAQIRRALACQNIQVSSHGVSVVRNDPGRAEGLINALSKRLGVAVDKPRLAVDLVNDLVSQRQKHPHVKTLRPIEKFVDRSGHLIMLNHPPADEEMRRLNIETGLLG